MWGGAIATLLLVAAWGSSERWDMLYYRHPWLVKVEPGGVDISRDPATMWRMPPGWHVVPRTDWRARIWRPTWEASAPRTSVTVPFWLPAVFTLGASLAAWRRDAAARRRACAGACARCGYSRAGLDAGAACPECGSKHLVV
jgi:hypothetical protein